MGFRIRMLKALILVLVASPSLEKELLQLGEKLSEAEAVACAASGAARITFATGVATPCCDGKICNVPDPGVGFKCAATATTPTTTATPTETVACAASGAACITFSTGVATPCRDGKICNVMDPGVGFKCAA